MKKRLLTITILAGLVLAIAPALLAQWPSFPTRGVPRNAAGQPDLTGPTPRTADGKPDFSGIWSNGGGGGGRGAQRGADGQRGGQRGDAQRGGDGQRGGQRAGGGAQGTAAGAAAAPANPIPLANFGNVGGGFPDGLPFQPWAADLVKKRMADNSKDNPDAHCLPMGFMQFHTHPQPRKVIQTPDVVILIYEANFGLRSIYLDGRPLPNEDAEPWWYGYSVGRWEGDTLVAETRYIRDGEWLDVRGSTLTTAAKVTERFRRPNYGTLEIEITVDDPKTYTRPWTVRLNQRVMPDTELIEFICEERDAKHYVGAQP
jgi:hypothetical protein